jgi:hypothetical protein
MSWEERFERLEKLIDQLAALMKGAAKQEWYSTRQFAAAVGLARFTVAEHCRFRRLNAKKANKGTGKSKEWRLSHEEMLRYQRDGLLPGVMPNRRRPAA